MRLILIALTALLSTSAVAANLSREVTSLLTGGLRLENLDALKKYNVILVPGFLNQKESGLLGWEIFAPQIDVLKKAGISYQRVNYDEDRIAVNARGLSKVIAASKKPVLLISHSLGAQIALEALLVDGRFDDPQAATHRGASAKALKNLCDTVLHRTPFFGWPTLGSLIDKPPKDCASPAQGRTPSIRNKVAGWITLNGNLGGTPLSDLVFDDNVSTTDALLRNYLNFRPSTLSINLFEMSTAVAGARLRDNASAIQNIVDRIPVISLAASYTPQEGLMGGKDQVDQLGNVLRKNGAGSNDGVVPTRNEILPGADYVILKGVSHFEMVKDFSEMNVNSRRVTTALLDLLSRKL